MAAKKNVKETITVKKENDEEVVLDVVHPSGKVYQEAQIIYASAWQKAVRGGAILKDKLEDFLKENDLWDTDKESQKAHLFKEISALDRKLAAGRMKLSEGKAISIEMLKKRNELRSLLEQRSSIEANTAESLAENQRFNYLVSQCVVYNKDGLRYFKDLEDYLEKMDQPEAYTAATKLATMLYSLDDDRDAGRPEIKFLKKYKFMNEDERFIRADGKVVDENGKLLKKVNDTWRYVNENDEFVDFNGDRVNEDGSPVVGDGSENQEAVFEDDINVNTVSPADGLASSAMKEKDKVVEQPPKKKEKEVVDKADEINDAA